VNALFITGTDTSVGKTVVAGMTARCLIDKGYSVATQKWVETGVSRAGRDIDTRLTPYSFKRAASPHLASRLEGKTISTAKINRSFKTLIRNFDFVVIEGTGGLLVPLNRKVLLIDVVRKLGLSVLAVAENKLGAINHTLLTIEALQSRDIPVLGIIFNEPRKDIKRDGLVLKDNPLVVGKFSGVQVLGSLPHASDLNSLYKYFKPIGERIWARLDKVGSGRI